MAGVVGGVTDTAERVDRHEAALLADEDVLVLDSGVGRASSTSFKKRGVS
jgi:hypothetical protein